MQNSQKGIIYLLRYLCLANHYHPMNKMGWRGIWTEL